MARKTFFGALAYDYITDSGRSLTEVAGLIGGTSPNQFSKWKTGMWTYIPQAKLERMIAVIAGRDQNRAAALMIAYLIDMTPEPLRHVIDIMPRDVTVAKSP